MAYLNSGGTVTTDGLYTVHTFLLAQTGTNFVCGKAGNAAVLVVGGGGGGGGSRGAGGGAGGYLYDAAKAVTVGNILVTVGVGGGGGASNGAVGGNGGNSKFNTSTAIEATGGGGGGGALVESGATGGSGGGRAGSAGTGASGTSGQGYAGGGSSGATGHAGGGGGGGSGGAGDLGLTTGTTTAAGGIGTANSISGTSITYATGGVGGDNDQVDATGATGTANEGDGGGGARNLTIGNTGGAGGSGIVIIRCLTTAFSSAEWVRNLTSLIGLKFLSFKRLVKLSHTFSTAKIAIDLISEPIISISKWIVSSIGLLSSLTRGKIEANRKIKPPVSLISGPIKRKIEVSTSVSTSIGLKFLHLSKGISKVFSSLIGVVSSFVRGLFESHRNIESPIGLLGAFGRLSKMSHYISARVGLITAAIAKEIGKTISSISVGLIGIVEVYGGQIYEKTVSTLLGLLVSTITTNRILNRTFSTIVSIDLLRERLVEYFREIPTQIGLLTSLLKQIAKKKSAVLALTSSFSRLPYFKRVFSTLVGLISSPISALTKVSRSIATTIGLISFVNRLAKWQRKWLTIDLTLYTLFNGIKVLSRAFSTLAGLISSKILLEYGKQFVTRIKLMTLFTHTVKNIRVFISNISIDVLSERFIEIIRYLKTSLGLVSSFVGQSKGNRLFTSVVDLLSSSITTLSLFSRRLSTTIDITLLQDRIVEYIRYLITEIGLLPSFLRNIKVSVILTSTIGLYSTFKRWVVNNRVVTSLIGLESILLRSIILRRIFTTIIGIDTLSEAISKFFRRFSNTLSLTAGMSRRVVWARINKTNLGLKSLLLRLIIVSRTKISSLSLNASLLAISAIKRIKTSLIGLKNPYISKRYAAVRFMSASIGSIAILVRLLFDIIGYRSIKFLNKFRRISKD